MPRIAEGVKVEGSNTPGREEEKRRKEGRGGEVKTKKETNRVTQYFIQEEIE